MIKQGRGKPQLFSIKGLSTRHFHPSTAPSAKYSSARESQEGFLISMIKLNCLPWRSSLLLGFIGGAITDKSNTLRLWLSLLTEKLRLGLVIAYRLLNQTPKDGHFVVWAPLMGLVQVSFPFHNCIWINSWLLSLA